MLPNLFENNLREQKEELNPGISELPHLRCSWAIAQQDCIQDHVPPWPQVQKKSPHFCEDFRHKQNKGLLYYETGVKHPADCQC